GRRRPQRRQRRRRPLRLADRAVAWVAMDAALPPGPREPAALQTLEWIARPTAFLRRCAARHGEAFTVRLAFDDAPVVGERSIIALDGPEHLRVRRLLLEPFRGDRMPTYRALVAELAHAAID